MGLETGDTIAALNPNWPLGSDPKSQGDDHLRLIKATVVNDVVSRTAGGTMLAALVVPAGATGLEAIAAQEAASATGLSAHIADLANPHQVTAAQAGATPVGHLTDADAHLAANITYTPPP